MHVIMLLFTLVLMDTRGMSKRAFLVVTIELSRGVCDISYCSEKELTRDSFISFFKPPASAFTLKNFQRHYSKQSYYTVSRYEIERLVHKSTTTGMD